MKHAAKLLLWGCFLLLGAHRLLAVSSIAALNCQRADGSSLQGAVEFFEVYEPGNVAYVGADFGIFAKLIPPTTEGTFSTCTISNGGASATLTGVTVSTVSAFGYGTGVAAVDSEAYTTLFMSYTGVTYAGLPAQSIQPALGTLACQSASGQSFSAPVFSFDFLVSSVQATEVDLNPAVLSTLLAELGSKTLNTCTLSAPPATIGLANVRITNAGLYGYGKGAAASYQELYALAGFSAGTETVSGATTPASLVPVATLSCPAGTGPAINAPVLEFELLSGVYDFDLDASAYGVLAAAQQSGATYAACVINDGNAPITLLNVSITAAGLSGYGGYESQVDLFFTGATLSFSAFSVGGATVANTQRVAVGTGGAAPVAQFDLPRRLGLR